MQHFALSVIVQMNSMVPSVSPMLTNVLRIMEMVLAKTRPVVSTGSVISHASVLVDSMEHCVKRTSMNASMKTHV